VLILFQYSLHLGLVKQRGKILDSGFVLLVTQDPLMLPEFSGLFVGFYQSGVVSLRDTIAADFELFSIGGAYVADVHDSRAAIVAAGARLNRRTLTRLKLHHGETEESERREPKPGALENMNPDFCGVVSFHAHSILRNSRASRASTESGACTGTGSKVTG